MDRMIVVPFRHVFEKPRKKRAMLAAAFTKEFLERHTKKPVKLSMAVNEAITGRGEHIPRHIRVVLSDEKEYMSAKLENEKPAKIKEKKVKKESAEKPKQEKKEPTKTEKPAEEKKVKKDVKGGKG